MYTAELASTSRYISPADLHRHPLVIPAKYFERSFIVSARCLKLPWRKLALLVDGDIKLPNAEIMERTTLLTEGNKVWHYQSVSEWQGEITITIDSGVVSDRTMYEIITNAGIVVGVGLYRPGGRPHGGPYGRFRLISLEDKKPWVRNEDTGYAQIGVMEYER
jgi:hypothetical protein